MKKIICELCAGMDFTKEDDAFICKGCGTKYTLEQAKGMMKEVEDDAAPVGGGASAVNANQQQVDNLLVLASNAHEAKNNKDAENYCNKAIELDATNYKAWFLKGKAVGWSSNVENQRIVEAARSFKQAVDFAPADEKERLQEEAAKELSVLGLGGLGLCRIRFTQYPDEEELNRFVSSLESFVDSLSVLYSKEFSGGLMEEAFGSNPLSQKAQLKYFLVKERAEDAGVPEEFFSKMACILAGASVDAFIKIAKGYTQNSHPLPDDFQKCITEIGHCISLALMSVQTCRVKVEEDIKRYTCMIKMQESAINMTAYPDRNSYSRTWGLVESAKIKRRELIATYNEKIAEIEKAIKERADEEKKARIAAYWEEHADEKAALESEKKELEDEKTKLTAEIAEQDKIINAAEADRSVAVPSEVESNKIMGQIKELENDRSKLGIFSGKKKKQIDEEIAVLQGNINALKSKVEEEKRARNAAADKNAAPAKAKRDELQSRLDVVINRLSDIDAELTKDPAEE